MRVELTNKVTGNKQTIEIITFPCTLNLFDGDKIREVEVTADSFKDGVFENNDVKLEIPEGNACHFYDFC